MYKENPTNFYFLSLGNSNGIRDGGNVARFARRGKETADVDVDMLGCRLLLPANSSMLIPL